MTTPTAPRAVLVLTHTGREEAVAATHEVLHLLTRSGLHVVMTEAEAALVGAHDVVTAPADGAAALAHVDLVVVLGGDGTLLRAAELTRGTDVPLLGVNLGHVGFLAEAEREDVAATVDRVRAGTWTVEERMTIDVSVMLDGEVVARNWAVNEASVEKSNRARMLEAVLEVDARPVSSFGCDGIVFATPTGSTAYAFSAGGPVVWPEVDALLVVPISAHALFAKPLVVSPRSLLAAEVSPSSPDGGVLWCDGRRTVELAPGSRVEVSRGAHPVRFARLTTAPFADRLVAKFELPVRGWRGRSPSRPAHTGSGGSL